MRKSTGLVVSYLAWKLLCSVTSLQMQLQVIFLPFFCAGRIVYTRVWIGYSAFIDVPSFIDYFLIQVPVFSSANFSGF